jgi:hypothetical protein
MYKLLIALLISFVSLPGFCQTTSSKYQPGTITAVAAHQIAPGEQASDVVRYDVSIKVADTLYVVLYTPTNGSNMVEYSPGLDFLVLVGSDTLTFNRSGSGTTTEVPILRREALAAGSGIDLSKAPSQYFSLKLQHLSEALHLRDDQQAKIKPILEQEAGELSQLWNNPAVSRKDKLNSLEKIVRSSDKKIKPLLSVDQVQKLEELRKEQKVELKKRISEETASKQN